MSTGPTGAEPRWSDDRAWYWDGTKWIPAAEVAASSQIAPSSPQPQTLPPVSSVGSAPTPPAGRVSSGGLPAWLAVVGLILCFPAGIVLTLLTHWSTKTKAIAIGVMLALYIATGVAIASSNQNNTQIAGGTTPAANQSSASPSHSPSPSHSSSPSPSPSQKASPSPSPKPQFATFGDGTFQVGKDIKPGTYRTREASPGCYFARLKGFGGTIGEIIANDNTDWPVVVTIASTDKGFQSEGCGTWTTDLSAITASRTTFGDGDYIVNTDMQPGTYKSSGSTGCYYARLRGFGHTINDIIANNTTDSAAIVTIAKADKGFESQDCGTWTKIG